MLVHTFRFKGIDNKTIYDFMPHEDEPEITMEQAQRDWV